MGFEQGERKREKREIERGERESVRGREGNGKGERIGREAGEERETENGLFS